MNWLLTLVLLSTDFSQVRKIDSSYPPVAHGGISGIMMPSGVPALGTGGAWLASNPLVWQLGNGTTSACTANETPVADTSPFCTAATSQNMCQETINVAGNKAWAFPVGVGDPTTNSWTAMALVKLGPGLSSAQYFGTKNPASGAGWWLGFDPSYAGGLPCFAEAADGTNTANPFFGEAIPAGWHTCAATYTVGGNFVVWLDDTPIATHSVAGYGSLSVGNPLIVGAIPGYGNYWSSAIGGAWFWNGFALSQTNMTAIKNTIASTGLGVVMPSTVPTPIFAWLPSRPNVNSMNTLQTATIYPGSRYATPTAPMCGSSQGGVGCLASQVFDGNQWFDCGTVGDPGTGHTSPANDFTVAVVFEDESGYDSEVVSKQNGATGYNISMGTVAYAGTFNGHVVNCLVAAGDGFSTGPETTDHYGRWTVCMGSYTAATGGMGQLCTYQNGIRNGWVLSDNHPSQNCETKTEQDVHTTAHFWIGGESDYPSANMNGRVVGVWYWPVALTSAQAGAFAAPWLYGQNSQTGYTTGTPTGQLTSFSAGM